jgi:sugar/nucleoside kinase (ribokinase family)/fructoselysine-6-P-deglycase FrlB-like protein
MEIHEQQDMHRANAAHPRVIVVGNLTIDDVVLPDGTTRMGSLGGNSLYTALGARLWHKDGIGIVTRRGDDFLGNLSDELRSLGITTDGIVDIVGPTVRNWVVYEANGERHWIYRTPRERSREVAVQPDDIPATWLQAGPSPVVHIAAMPIDAAEAIVDRVKRIAQHAMITLDTHEDYVVDYRQRLRTLAAKVHAFLPSRSEVADLVGYDDPRRALSDLTGLPTPIIVIKMGAEGALVWDKGQQTLHDVGVAAVSVVDVTGAGDAFCGGFAAGLSLGCSPVESVQRGTISASYAVASFGSMELARIDPSEGQARILSDPPAVRLLPSPAARATIEVEGADRGISSGADIMREEIAMIPRLLMKQHEVLDGQIRGLAHKLNDAGIEHLYLSGCGDSAFAGAATALAFQKHAGIDAEGIHALDLARYRVRYLPKNSAVVCISFSGKVGRTIEAAKQGRRFGHRVIVLTGNSDSPLAQEATDILALSVPTLGYSPGTSTYLAILAALYDLAVTWGDARGRDSIEARRLLRTMPELAQQTLAAADGPVQSAAKRMVQRHWIAFLGAGPNLATAQFGAAKLFEGPQKLGVATSIEEWAHEEYFISGRGTPVCMIAPSGASSDRAHEILSELNFIGADTMFLSDTKPTKKSGEAGEIGTFIPIIGDLPEEFSPLLTALPLSLLAFYLTQASGQERFEFSSPGTAQEHYETIHRVTQGEPA